MIYLVGGFIENRLQYFTESTPIRIEIYKNYFIRRCKKMHRTNVRKLELSNCYENMFVVYLIVNQNYQFLFVQHRYPPDYKTHNQARKRKTDRHTDKQDRIAFFVTRLR